MAEAETLHYQGSETQEYGGGKLRQLDAAGDPILALDYAARLCGFQAQGLVSALAVVLSSNGPKNWRTKPTAQIVRYIAASARRRKGQDETSADTKGRWTEAQRAEAAERDVVCSLATVKRRGSPGDHGGGGSRTVGRWGFKARGYDSLEREASEAMARACLLYAAKVAGLEGTERKIVVELSRLLKVDAKHPGRVDPNALNRAARAAMPGRGAKLYEQRRRAVESVQRKLALTIASGRFESPRLDPKDPRVVAALPERDKKTLGLR